MKWFGRIAAIAMLLCIPVSLAFPYLLLYGPGFRVARDGDRQVVTRVDDPALKRMGLRAGDLVDLGGMSVGDRVRLLSPPMFRPFSVTVTDRVGRQLIVPTTAVAVSAPRADLIANAIVAEAAAVVALILAAIIFWRRPGAIAIAYGSYALGFLYALPTSSLLGFLPEPLFSAAVVVVVLLVATLPQLALVAFALRFPRPLDGARGPLVTRTVDAILVALCILAAFRTAFAPTLRDVSDPWLDTAPVLAATVALVIIVLVRYARTRGDDRRRLGWVAVGSILSAIGYLFLNLDIVGSIDLPGWLNTVAVALTAALPIALAYAILRHRVLDLGFAINRTLVYSVITATLVVAVGLVDWLSGKILGNTHVSAAVEAAATVALGVALSWFHGRVERGVDRVLFRRRYVAANRIQSRIAALGFATTTEAVDQAMVAEVIDVMGIASAAVFRRGSNAAFVRSAAAGWDACASEFSVDHLLPRTLRAHERPVVLADAGVRDDRFPAGSARPDVAIPIVVRHEFLGFVLYGHRAEEASLDPEETDLLVRLVAAAALAYDAIDAADWRRRAIELQRLPALG